MSPAIKGILRSLERGYSIIASDLERKVFFEGDAKFSASEAFLKEPQQPTPQNLNPSNGLECPGVPEDVRHRKARHTFPEKVSRSVGTTAIPAVGIYCMYGPRNIGLTQVSRHAQWHRIVEDKISLRYVVPQLVNSASAYGKRGFATGADAGAELESILTLEPSASQVRKASVFLESRNKVQDLETQSVRDKSKRVGRGEADRIKEDQSRRVADSVRPSECATLRRRVDRIGTKRLSRVETWAGCCTNKRLAHR
eukprot:Gb_34195 [translate_table: standard]